MKIKSSIQKKNHAVNLAIIAILLTWLTFALYVPARSGELLNRVYAEGEGKPQRVMQLAHNDLSSLPLQAQYAISTVLAREDPAYHNTLAKLSRLLTDTRRSWRMNSIMQKAKLTASSGAGNEFGYSVAISGDTVVVGVEISSAVYVFSKPAGGWATMTETAKLTPYGLAPGFGNSVSISGDTIVVGAPEATVSGEYAAGEAFVFVKPHTGWANMTQTAKLWSLFPSTYEYFGYSVSVSGDTIVIGEPGDNGAGDAYVFVKPEGGWTTGLTYQAKLVDNEVQYDYFGQSVSVNGDAVVVGAPNVEVNGKTDQGAVYVFVKPVSGWASSWMTPNAKLTASDGSASDYFGDSVSISGDTMAVGAPGATIASNTLQGAAYMFSKPGGGWATTSTFAAKLIVSDGSADDYFGKSVSVSGDTVVVGAPYVTTGSNTSQGAAYVFVKPGGGWVTTSTCAAKLTASDGAANDDFGYAVAISGVTMVAGAKSAQVDGNSYQGAAYVFEDTNKIYLPLILRH